MNSNLVECGRCRACHGEAVRVRDTRPAHQRPWWHLRDVPCDTSVAGRRPRAELFESTAPLKLRPRDEGVRV